MADAVGKHSFRRCRRSLKPRGIYISVDLGFMYHVPLLALITHGSSGAGVRSSASAATAKRTSSSSRSSSTRASTRPVIDRRYTLDEVVDATRYVETGQKTGNVVLRVSEAAP